MASNIVYVDMDGMAQPKKNSKILRQIIGAVAAGFMLGAAINILSSVAPEMASGANGPVELMAGTSSFMKTAQATRVKSPYASQFAPPFAENYLGKLGDREDTPLTHGGSFSPAPASFSPAASGNYSPEQLAFMQRAGKVASVVSAVPASSSTAASGGFSPEQLAFLERKNVLPGGASPAPASFSSASSSGSSSSGASRGFAPTMGASYGANYRRERIMASSYGSSSSRASRGQFAPTMGASYGASYGASDRGERFMTRAMAEFSPEQLAFMERAGKLPSGASPAPASFSTAASGGFSPEQLAFMERQNALRGGASPAPASFSSASSYGSSSSPASREFAPTKGASYGASYRR